MIELTEADKAIDLKQKLRETVDAIAYLSSNGIEIPAEAIELQGILTVAVVNQSQLKTLRNGLEKLASIANDKSEYWVRQSVANVLKAADSIGKRREN